MSDEAPEEEAQPAEPSEPRPKRRSSRRARRVEADAPEVEEKADAAPDPADDRPAFARSFPDDPALAALVAAFEAGDYARVRREAPALAKRTDRDDVRAAARELRRRLDPDPLASYLLGIAALLLVFLAGWYWMHAHAP
ncbi:Hypothetical protein A7982_08930 [Minicystis rosea]|nr:Hypothetical protein A7982_08930 [Minicystis rosea]